MMAPTRISLFPRLAWAALKAGEEVDFTAWSLLREHSATRLAGRGSIPRREALELIREWRPNLNPDSTTRALRRLVQRGYCSKGAGRLWLASAGRLMARQGLTAAGVPHRVPIELLRTPSAMRAQLYATVHPLPNHSGAFISGGLSRELIEGLTGCSRRVQQKYDHVFGVTQLVQECHALVENHEGPIRVGMGYWGDSQGRQWRRLPDLRTPRDHWLGSKSAARLARRRARALADRSEYSRVPEGASCEVVPTGNEPSDTPERFERTYHVATTEEAARSLLTCPRYSYHLES